MALSDIYQKRPVLCAAIAAFIILIIKGFITQTIGSPGVDSDDVTRLIQIRDFLGGQSWFDVSQYRMGISGTDMHWSRLVDLPIIILIQIFSLFLSPEMAEAVAISVWPPLTGSLVIWGVYIGAKHHGAKRPHLFPVLLAFLYVVGHFRFNPGALDHHNVQFGLLSLAVGYALNPDHKIKSAIIAGICTAIAFAIAAEIYVFGAVICAFFATIWLFKGNAVKDSTIAFGLSFALIVSLCFFLTTAPSRYDIIACDTLSLITVIAAVTGGLGLAILAFLLSKKNTAMRAVGLAALAVIFVVIFTLTGPQCLSNPLSNLPDDVRALWLDNVMEAAPLLEVKTDPIKTILFFLGVSVTAIIISAGNIIKRRNISAYAFLLALIILAVILGLYQLRFATFAQLFSLIVLGLWVDKEFARNDGKSDEERSLRYVGALALSIPAVWSMLGLLNMNTAQANDLKLAKEKAALCQSNDVISALQTLPSGLVLATSNTTGLLLQHTDHRALNGNYHRNSDGIEQSIRIFTAPPENALAGLKQNQIDYIIYCKNAGDANIFKDHSPNGLMAALIDGNPPAYLTPAVTSENGTTIVYTIASDQIN